MSLGVARNPIYHVKRLPSQDTEKGRKQLPFAIDGRNFAVKLVVSNLTKALIANLPERSLDLLEIAGLVYGVDSAISRGGTTDSQMGKKWHRQFQVELPVRELAFWRDEHIKRELEEMLMFLSGDRFIFEFVERQVITDEPSPFFELAQDNAWQPDRVLMFSGGLDSFAGALEEIAEQKQKLALISHFSSSKIKHVQKQLNNALVKKFGNNVCQHIPIQVQMMKSGLKEGTHRARSFLFAVLGSVTAQAYGKNRVSFYENGVVSLNLPPVGNVLGTRATRTTHPQTLTRFSNFLDKVFNGGMRVDNPYFWRTKRDVVETIARLGMASEISQTRSCADVHHQITQHPHCGRCSQCIDRRFSILAAGLEQYDPAEAYRVDLLKGAREALIDREVALSYVRNAFAYEHMTPQALRTHFPAVLDAVAHLDNPENTALEMIADLLRRHSASISSVMRGATDKTPPNSYPETSLPRLYGDATLQLSLPEIANLAPAHAAPTQMRLEIDEAQQSIKIDQAIEFINSATARLLIALAKKWLEGAGQGLDPLDYPLIKADALAKELGLASDESLRKTIKRARRNIKARCESLNLDTNKSAELIENIPWQGYRLNPLIVDVRKLSH